jgi:hypothetical protein
VAPDENANRVAHLSKKSGLKDCTQSFSCRHFNFANPAITALKRGLSSAFHLKVNLNQDDCYMQIINPTFKNVFIFPQPYLATQKELSDLNFVLRGRLQHRKSAAVSFSGKLKIDDSRTKLQNRVTFPQ